MTLTVTAPEEISPSREHRFRLHRAGILNVWQYDDQEFQFADGRLLLRGANGAGKSKTLEMLLPFVLDGDKARMTASARHHTSLLWLMTDGYDGQARVGYLWVEFARTTPGGAVEHFTCGVGIRATVSARAATAWYFTTGRRVGDDLRLEDDAGPLSRPRLVEELAGSGQVFEHARAYKEHVGRSLFGLDTEQYDEVLRLLYWLRQPQVGEDIDPVRLAGQLLQALPQLDEQAVRTAGDTFDELVAVGEQLDRRAAAAEALTVLSDAYARYAGAAAADRADGLLGAQRDHARRRSELRRAERQRDEVTGELDERDREARQTAAALDDAHGRLRALEESPEARSQRRLADLARRSGELDDYAARAERAVDRADERLKAGAARLADRRDQVVDRAQRQATTARTASHQLAELVPDAAVGISLPDGLDRLDEARLIEVLGRDLERLPASVEQARHHVGQRQAAVVVVREALGQVQEASRATAEADRRAADAEARWERASASATQAHRQADQLADTLAASLATWAAQPAAPAAFVVPDELTVDTVEGLGDLATGAAEPVLQSLAAEQQQHVLARDRAADEIAELEERRASISAERDPAPPAPALPRTARDGGAALWRLIDFAPGLDAHQRAGLEAALQAAGLLDAWVRPDGRLLDADHLDTVLVPGAPAPGPHLGELLVADVPTGCEVGADVVAALLARISVGPAPGEEPDGAPDPDLPAVAVDGRWALGPLAGRARKPQAQYVGATARAEERERRLAEVDAALTLARHRHHEASTQLARVDVAVADLRGWLAAVPPVQPLLRAWTTAEERTAAAAETEREHRATREQAERARRELGLRRDELRRLADQQHLPEEEGPLAAVEERLRDLYRALERLALDGSGLLRELQRWAEDVRVAETEGAEAERLRADADRARQDADRARAELEELEASVGSDVATLRARMAELTAAVETLKARAVALDARLRELYELHGETKRTVASAEERLAEAEQARSAAATRFAEMAGVPGLLDAAADRTAVDTAPLLVAASSQAGEALPRGLLEAASSLAQAGTGTDATDAFNQVYRAHQEASTGPAADHEPRLLPFGELLAVVGRDDGGEHPIVQLAARVRAAVEQDRGLLTERERAQFEQHILGELGEAIRRRRLEAAELVAAMNKLLGQVSTSQGLRVRLDWRLRDDVPTEARDAVRLLTEPLGALLPEERAALRDSLHRLIGFSRAEQPELSYAEHLAVALDYRRWFAFRIRYTRPEAEGRWLDLHRRSPLSQGEQKVLCYLPLFAAAAAHFSSLAGAAPQAPRLVLLDDAFPKIDVRTHPLLFGLLVQLDLDFVVTSERLWGDHDTVPSLAIYEALRDPAQRGIAQYEFRWDGRALRAMT